MGSFVSVWLVQKEGVEGMALLLSALLMCSLRH